MKVKKMDKLPAHQNAFNHDLFHMGIELGLSANLNDRILVMMPNHADELCKYIIIVNESTGERIEITF
jgi:uncharacterized protein (DUF2384 family)